MKAYLMAAGLGTRLRPITDTTAKCLVPICGRPLLGWWFELLERHGVTEVLVNTHHLADQVRQFIEERNRLGGALRVYETYEPELLGSGGTLRANRDFVVGEENFFICYADNLTDVDLTAFRRFHESRDSVLSMALFYTNVPKQCGIAELDGTDTIVSFTEKPEHPASDLANAGIYIADDRIFDHLDQEKEVLDIGKDVLPRLVGKMTGWNIQGYLIDIGTHENYRKAQREWNYDHH